MCMLKCTFVVCACAQHVHACTLLCSFPSSSVKIAETRFSDAPSALPALKAAICVQFDACRPVARRPGAPNGRVRRCEYMDYALHPATPPALSRCRLCPRQHNTHLPDSSGMADCALAHACWSAQPHSLSTRLVRLRVPSCGPCGSSKRNDPCCVPTDRLTRVGTGIVAHEISSSLLFWALLSVTGLCGGLINISTFLAIKLTSPLSFLITGISKVTDGLSACARVFAGLGLRVTLSVVRLGRLESYQLEG